jgi:glutamyl-tRNA synthetase
LHVGGARTALYNWLLAKQTKGQFIIRVEDTDEARSTRESEESILNDLKWLGMNWDEGPEIGGPYAPYRQSERKDIYLKYAEQLVSQGYAYRCFCSEEELEEKRQLAEAEGKALQYDGTWRDADPVEVQKKIDNGEPYTIRFKVPPGKTVFIDDMVRGRVTWDAEASLGDFIILRSSGMPVYNFCVAVDDASMKITHVIRAEEHLTNTLRQILVLEALGYTPPTYAHCSLILGSDRSKLSKRHGATSCKQFSEQGFLPDAMVNYLAALGWNDGTTKEIYSKGIKYYKYKF